MDAVERVLSVQCEAGESPRWDGEARCLYWADIVDPHLYLYRPLTGELKTYPASVPVTGIGLRKSGGLVLASKTGLHLLDADFHTYTFLANPEAGKPNIRFNDGMVDRQGRYWAATLNETDFSRPDGSLYRLDADGALHTLDTRLNAPNGMGWSPDDKTMYLADSGAQVVYAYDFDSSAGAIANRRIFARVPKEEGMPDGLAVDGEGGVWLGHWGGGHLKRYDPAGGLERKVPLPVSNVTACAFGGTNLDELYVTTAWFLLSAEERQAEPAAGDLFRVWTGIRGLVEPKFLG
jgi:sugar lactone lactonase YvrE